MMAQTKETSIANNHYKWEKNEKGDLVGIYYNDENIIDECETILHSNDKVLIFYPLTSSIFQLSSFNSNSSDGKHDLKELSFPTDKGFWYKYKEIDGSENFKLFNENGKIYDFSSVKRFSYNEAGHCIIQKINGENLVMENPKSAMLHTVAPILIYNSKEHEFLLNVSTLDHNSQPYEIESNYTWKKDNGNSYWLYKDGKHFYDKKSMWNGDNLLAIDGQANALVSLKGYKKGLSLQNYKAFIINVDISNGFWFRTDANSFVAYDKNGNTITGNLEKTTWTEDGNSLVIKPKAHDNSFMLLNYKNAPINRVYPLIVKD